jgi:hypothetical protein
MNKIVLVVNQQPTKKVDTLSWWHRQIVNLNLPMAKRILALTLLNKELGDEVKVTPDSVEDYVFQSQVEII